MKVLVTGGLGFIGSNFILKALNENKELSVINVDAEFQGSDHKNLDSIKNNEKYSFVKGNITNKNLMEKLISKVDAVVNFAAESFVDRSILDPNPFLISNIRGTYTILELIKKEKKRFVQISTDEVYGSLETGTAVENSRFNPSSPYAATKAAAELLVNSYNTTFECDSMITRCTNNFGPRQYPEKLIPKVILLANQNKKIPVYGNGKNIRDWIFVEDHCEAVLQVLLNGKNGESYNISAKNEIDNLTIVKKILEILNKSEDLIEFVEDRPGHDIRYSLDSEKIRNELGWTEKIDFDTGIERTVKWYLTNQELFLDNTDTQQTTPWK
ncbi:MAG: dTDP-glucose 4,6-dehydratase [Chloroflexi bacterium]|nr:dTDP-glucose 4,6-dehydratase [Chloroflexota bacterium]|tara:strand:- start:24283 stop:25263 length:981 start_codon:yes stop_codon:yes gene_type:complete